MEDTEWNDILRAKGIIPEITQEQVEEIVDETIRQHLENPLERATLDELAELEDDELEDTRIIEEYKQKRMAEFRLMSSGKYGTVVEISKPDYQTEVTDASKDTWVIVLLYQTSVLASNLIERELVRIAAKYRSTKILKIQADRCIENYPMKNVPTLLVYGEGDMKKQLISMTERDVKGLEGYLRALGALDKRIEYEDQTAVASEDSSYDSE